MISGMGGKEEVRGNRGNVKSAARRGTDDDGERRILIGTLQIISTVKIFGEFVQ